MMGVFLTTENEGLCLRERDLVKEAGIISDQIACNLDSVRRTTDGCEFLFVAERGAIQIGILILWLGRKKVSFH